MLKAPFYPIEAEKKGATATEYGLVFGIFELVVFLASPYLGAKLNGWGARRVFNLGIATTGTCSILFGMLDNFDNPRVFIGLSFVIRIIEALGNSAFLTSSFTIIARYGICINCNIQLRILAHPPRTNYHHPATLNPIP